MAPFSQTSVDFPKQIISLLCIVIVVQSPTLILVGLVLGYIIMQQKEPEIRNIYTQHSAEQAQTSYSYKYKKKLKIHTPSYVTKYKQQQEKMEEEQDLPGLVQDDEGASNSSLDFERFPSCPTTLPRLDTHFNFVEDTNHIDKTHTTKIDWTAIHQELEYDQQREERIHGVKKLPIVDNNNTTSLMKKASVFGSLYKLKQIPEYTQTLFTRESEIYEDDEEVDDVQSLEDIQTQDDIFTIELTAQPINSSHLLFKNKIKKAVKKMKQSTNKTIGQNEKASFPFFDDYTNILPHPSASTRMHDHFKVKLNKLFKK